MNVKNTLQVLAATVLLAGLTVPTAALAAQTAPSPNVAPIWVPQIQLQDRVNANAGANQISQSAQRVLPLITVADLRTLNFGTPVFGYDDPGAAQVPSETPDRDDWMAGI
ncbi:hypothetical protein EPN44_01155 [bacterium]|nr:MAG: hypothetical protein EPN44_01155 [bacterium]